MWLVGNLSEIVDPNVMFTWHLVRRIHRLATTQGDYLLLTPEYPLPGSTGDVVGAGVSKQFSHVLTAGTEM